MPQQPEKLKRDRKEAMSSFIKIICTQSNPLVGTTAIYLGQVVQGSLNRIGLGHHATEFYIQTCPNSQYSCVPILDIIIDGCSRNPRLLRMPYAVRTLIASGFFALIERRQVTYLPDIAISRNRKTEVAIMMDLRHTPPMRMLVLRRVRYC